MSVTILGLKDYFEKLNKELCLAPNFIFGGDEAALREAIGNFGDDYMFGDFGEINSSLDGLNRMQDGFLIAITLAHPYGVNSITNDDILCDQDRLLKKMNVLKKELLKRDRCVPWLKYLQEPFQILPFIAPDISRSIGWTMPMILAGADMFDVH